MKPNFKLVLILTFFALLFVTSCQNEFLEESTQNQEETLVPDSVLTSKMLSTVTNNGSLDNILDESSCFSVNLPVTIIVNGITITIDSLEDLELIEEIYEEFDDDTDNLDFLFPIAIILNNYEEIIIENQDALEDFIEECVENEVEDSIECVDFVYPISMSIYNSVFQIIDNVTFNNDEELYDFLDVFEDDSDDQLIIASLDFPVSLIYSDGTMVEVNSNQELQTAINASAEDCYEHEDECTEEDLAMYLKECAWEIESFNQDDNLSDYYFYFGAEGALEIRIEGDMVISGNWSLSTSDNGDLELVIRELTALSEDFEGSWIIAECDDDYLKLIREAGGITTTIVMEQECEDDIDCSAQEIALSLKECKWWMGTSLLSPNYSGPLFFNHDGEVQVGYPDGNELLGTWELALTDSGVYIILELPGDYQVISLEWKVIECEDHRIKLVAGDHYLVLEQECWEESPLGCLEANPIVMCDIDNDGYEVFNLYAGLSEIEECDQINTVSVSFHTSLADAQSNEYEITDSITAYTNVTSPQTIYVRVEVSSNPSEYEILEIDLKLEDCNEYSCTEEEIDAILMECHWIPVNVNGSNDYSNVVMVFGDNQNLTAEAFGGTAYATWSTAGNNTSGVYVSISQFVGDLEVLNGQWLVTECSEEMLHLKMNDSVLELKRECN